MTRARRPGPGRLLSRWTKHVISLLVGSILVILVGVPYVIAWWHSLPLVQQALIGFVTVSIVVLAVEQFVRRTLGVSPLRGLILFIRYLQTVERPQSGREVFHSGYLDDVRAAIASRRNQEEVVPVEYVERRDQSGPPVPTLDTDVSLIVLGQSGSGKTTFVKSRIAEWELDAHGVIAHSLSEGRYDTNEFEQFFRDECDQPVLRVSSQDSDARWDPFLDYSESVTEMQNIADGMFAAEDGVDTGWTPAANSLLVAALVVTSAKYGDFAKLADVLEWSPEQIREEIEQVEGASRASTPLRGLSADDLHTVHSVLLNSVGQLLDSDLFDRSLDRFSLREYYRDPQGVIVLDNIQRDRYARGFWRFFLESAIDLSFESPAEQYFVIDELDKLPPIENVTTLASAGRSAGSLGLFVLQDVHQLRDAYGELAKSVYVNCPNRVSFNPGDRENAAFALGSIGEYEVPSTRISHGRSRGEASTSRRTVNQTRSEVQPLLASDLLQAETGKALVQSPHGWWFCQLEEPGDVT